MTRTQRKEISIKILKHYGESKQRFKLLEEIGEFSVELARMDLGRKISKSLIGETADILNMIDQFLIMQGPEFRKDVEDMRDYKLNRTLDRMEEEIKTKNHAN